MNKRGQIEIMSTYKILFFSIIAIIIIAGIIFSVWKFNNPSLVDCGIGKYDSRQNACLFNQTSNQPVSVIKCPSGFNLNETQEICEKIVESVYVCNTAEGTYNSSSGICLVSVQNTQYVCQNGTYNSSSGKCDVIIENFTYSCINGTIQEINGTNFCVVLLKVIKEQMVIYCGNGECDDKERAQGICPEDCNETIEIMPDVPYSFLAVHFEIDPSGESAIYIWQNMVNMVDLANQYNTPLTIMFWPGSAEYALASPERIAQVREWQAQGHEIGIHNQGCFGDKECTAGSAGCHQESNNQLYEQLAGEHTIKSGTTVCALNLISTYKYEGGGRPDGRSAVAIKYVYDLASGHEIYGLNIKAGYAGGTPIKIAQYNTLNKDEIYGFVNHGEGDAGTGLGGTVELKEWLNFLYEKDPEGKKRMTLSKIMENYVLPNNLVASMEDVCSSTDSRIRQCLAPARLSTKSDSINCMAPYDTGVFNFGRCLNTGTYCNLENGLSEEQLCSISRGDYYLYVPTTCVIKNIEDYEPPICNNVVEGETCSEIGGTICTKDQKCSGKIKISSDTENCCVDGSCVTGGTSPECGDGYCDGPTGEKETCPSDCVVIKK